MRTPRGSTTVLVLLAVVSAGRLQAQDEAPHGRSTSETLRPVSEPASRYPQGFLSLSMGAGSESFRYSGTPNAYSSPITAPVFTLGVGARLNQFMDLGLEGYGWVDGEQQGTITMGGVMFITRLHPFGKFLYVKGGGGIASTNYWNSSDCGCSSGPTYVGFAYSVGAGLEIPMGHNVALEPMADIFYQSYSGRSFPAYTERILHLGLGISLGFGH